MNPKMMIMTEILQQRIIFKPSEVAEMVEAAEMTETIKTTKKISYYNYPCGFDTETTSIISPCGEKAAFVYEWTLGLNGALMIGRTIEDFVLVCEKLSEYLNLSEFQRLVIYVHNLGFDFQFIRKYFHFSKVFSVDERRPVYAVTDSGIEFRCSYILSSYNLETIGKNLTRYKVNKAVGDLDYNLIRHAATHLTEKEIGYCLNDVKVIMCYIQEKIEDDGDITKIPLTNTGYVRGYCKRSCLYAGGTRKNPSKDCYNFRRLIKSLTLTVPEYQQLKRGFQGGFTHANAKYSGSVLSAIESYDFTSSYPYVMCSEKFPMSAGKIVKIETIEDIKKYLDKYCCLFDIDFYDIQPREFYENYISVSKCWNCKNVIENNGRVAWADRITTTVTEQDYQIIKQLYSWEKVTISNFRIYRKGYLPTSLIKAILKLYADKTTLKGVEGKEVEYMKSKGMINSVYGMTVTDISRNEIEYNGEWSKQAADVEKDIEKYNKSKSRFLFYPWGVWVTAYARRNLFTGITEFGDDYIYSDTDSIKVKNADLHADYIRRYNNTVMQKLRAAADFHKINVDCFSPKTIEGKIKTLGLWDDEGEYTRFKTLGAKRYMTDKNGDISITVSGVNKKSAIPFITKNFKNPFDGFNNNLFIPAQFTGKLTHTYIDTEQHGVITDYTGLTAEYHSLSSVHLSGAEYSLSLSDKYIEFMKGVKEYEN